MANVLKLKRSTTASDVPTTSDLADGEVAVNLADQKIYVRNGGSIVVVADATAGAPTFTSATVSGNLSVEGNTTLGNATSDTVTVTGRVNSDIVPSSNNARDLGTTSLRWKDLFLSGTTINLGGATLQSDGTGNITISGAGATLPAGSKVGADLVAKADSETGVTKRSVPLYVQVSGETVLGTTFQFAASNTVFTSWMNSSGTDFSDLYEQPLFTF